LSRILLPYHSLSVTRSVIPHNFYLIFFNHSPLPTSLYNNFLSALCYLMTLVFITFPEKTVSYIISDEHLLWLSTFHIKRFHSTLHFSTFHILKIYCTFPANTKVNIFSKFVRETQPLLRLPFRNLRFFGKKPKLKKQDSTSGDSLLYF